MKNYYNKKVYSISGARKKAILGLIQKENPLVLDIGCGDGSLGEILKKEKKAVVYGIDISERSLKVAESRLEGAFLLDIEKDEWPKELREKKFDYIILTEVLEHLIDPKRIMERVKKLVHRDTELIITVPNVLFWKNRLRIFFGNFDYEDEGLMDQGHIHFFSWKSFRKMFWQAGYEIIEIQNHVPTRGTKILGKLFPGLFSYQFIVKAREK